MKSRRRARSRVLGRWMAGIGVVFLSGAALGACGSGSASSSAPRASAGGGACLDATADGALCETLVSYFARCTASKGSTRELGEDCRATWGHFASRANGCFVERLGECLGGPCESVDTERCFREATVASDPESFDASSGEACTAEGDCDGVTDGWMGRCVQRFDDCSVESDLCATAVSLTRPYRSEVEGCFEQECGALADCVYAVTGHH